MRVLLAGVVVSMTSAAAFAHFPILLPSTPFAEVNQKITFTFAVGHPFEQEYENAPKPAALYALKPGGQKVDLLPELKESARRVGASGVKVWNVAYTSNQKGDVVLALDSEPSVSDDSVYQEFLKTVLHIDRQDGWRTRTGQPLEIVSLTRPYGLETGDVFTGRLMAGDQALPDTEVYVEYFNPVAPESNEIPDEPFVTKTVVTDPNGVFTVALPQEGWWICGAYVDDGGKVKREDKELTLRGLAAIWVYVGRP